MPELPDITIYLESLEQRILGRVLRKITISTPFLLRTVNPPIGEAVGRPVVELRRIGKRVVIGLKGDLWLVVHLMIAGRLHWFGWTDKPARRKQIAVFEFENGSLTLTEAGTKKRASLHLVRGEDSLAAHDPGGLEVLDSSAEAFAAVLKRENHTLKRALTDPHLLSGIGNAYSDEILHAARLSPVLLTVKLTEEEMTRLHKITVETLNRWIAALREETGDKFPEKVTAFRPNMAVHGKFGRPCPVCGSKVQRIQYASNETNYCPTCQTGGRLLADRSLSRLLKKDWPATPEALDELRSKGKTL